MIADSDDILPILSTSIWENEGPISSCSSAETVVFSMEDSVDDAIVTRVTHENEHHVSQFSMQSSVTSSECGSDDLYTEIGTDIEDNLLRLSESLTSPLFSYDGNETVCFSDSSTNWNDTDINSNVLNCNTSADTASDILIPSVSSSPVTSPFQNRKSMSSTSNSSFDKMQQWTEMTSYQQLSAVQDLTEIVSQQMGLREQLEVIRIINPYASVSPTDTEFVIDLERLNDEKLQEVRTYIKKFKTENSSSMQRQSMKQVMSDSCSECSSSGLTPSKNTPKKKLRRQSKEHHIRQRKHRRQELKEKRSGLFEKEEVLSLHMPEQLAEVDIDILT